MNFMIKADCPFTLPEVFGGLVERYIPLCPHSLDADMTASTLSIGGKGCLAVMASTAVLSAVQGFHVEILLFLNL
jgi:hypothetical protein